MAPDIKKPELLAPAGNLDKLKMAIIYGADAVYVGGENFSLRAAADNFTYEQMKEGIDFAHARGKKVYVAVNIFPHNHHMDIMPEYIKSIGQLQADAIIVADLGVFDLVRELCPDMKIHVSTQANNVNWRSAQAWHKLGAQRIVLARELSLEEISQIRTKVSQGLQLEAFVHGAMCVSYSGRCLLSSYMTERDANTGQCAQPCRWQYHLMEMKRPGQYFPVYEDSNGTFILNSKDLCMIRHIPEMIKSGIDSFKIEGRVKTSYYVSVVVKAYREAIDAYCSGRAIDPYLYDEVQKVSHRDYSTGFYMGNPLGEGQIYGNSSYIRPFDIVGIVTGYRDGCIIVEQKNKFEVGDKVEFVQPGVEGFSTFEITQMKDQDGQDITSAPHAQMVVQIPSERICTNSIMRKMV